MSDLQSTILVGTLAGESYGDMANRTTYTVEYLHVELRKLQRWVTQDRCQLIEVLAIGGMGKTALAVKLAQLDTLQGLGAITL